jgi:hypothetical protein
MLSALEMKGIATAGPRASDEDGGLAMSHSIAAAAITPRPTAQ